MTTETEQALVPGRTCGTCNVCCIALTIDEPALRKPQGFRCRNAQSDNSCAIYETRPDTCRTFFCGFRQLRWVRDTLRPDVSGVLIKQHGEIARATGQRRMGIAVTLLNGDALKAEGLAETVAAAVAADIPVFLNVPGPPGYTSAEARMNEVLADAVHRRDKSEILKLLRIARSKGRSGKRDPIRFEQREARSDPSGGTTVSPEDR
jgi:hypothetical protein